MNTVSVLIRDAHEDPPYGAPPPAGEFIPLRNQSTPMHPLVPRVISAPYPYPLFFASLEAKFAYIGHSLALVIGGRGGRHLDLNMDRCVRALLIASRGPPECFNLPCIDASKNCHHFLASRGHVRFTVSSLASLLSSKFDTYVLKYIES